MEGRENLWTPALDEWVLTVTTVDSLDTYQKNALSPGEKRGHVTNVERNVEIISSI